MCLENLSGQRSKVRGVSLLDGRSGFRIHYKNVRKSPILALILTSLLRELVLKDKNGCFKNQTASGFKK